MYKENRPEELVYQAENPGSIPHGMMYNRTKSDWEKFLEASEEDLGGNPHDDTEISIVPEGDIYREERRSGIR